MTDDPQLNQRLELGSGKTTFAMREFLLNSPDAMIFDPMGRCSALLRRQQSPKSED